jgi:hypothetical protein
MYLVAVSGLLGRRLEGVRQVLEVVLPICGQPGHRCELFALNVPGVLRCCSMTSSDHMYAQHAMQQQASCSHTSADGDAPAVQLPRLSVCDAPQQVVHRRKAAGHKTRQLNMSPHTVTLWHPSKHSKSTRAASLDRCVA